jgi:hypothetical protein
MLKDIRYAFRTLCQNPGFALTAIISIALGIDANSAIFAMADGMLLRPLAVPNPSNIVSLRARAPNGNFDDISYADFVDMRDKNRSFESLVAYDIEPAGFAKDAATQPQLKAGLLVSGNFFSTLYVQPYRPTEYSLRQNKNLGIRNYVDFGAESSRPTCSLSTLLSRRSPDERQDSLSACLLRL